MEKIVKTAPLGIFDSGVGGLTVAAEVIKQLPYESYIYYADTAHVPYGPRAPQELKGFAHAITTFLVEQGCKMVLIACNTSTSLSYEQLSEAFAIPLVGVIEPGIDKALTVSKNGHIGVLGTQATINSGAFERLFKEKNQDIRLTCVACPRFVPLIEKGEVQGREVEAAAQEYLGPLISKGIDTLVLGCTHYPFLEPVLRDILGPNVTIVNPAIETVRQAGLLLKAQNGLSEQENPRYKYYASSAPAKFQSMGSSFLGRAIDHVEKINLDKGRIDV